MDGLVPCLSREIRISKERRTKLTEIIPHKPQNRWLARVYFSASSISCSTSLSLGWFPTDIDGDFRWDESEYIHSKVKASFVFLFNLIRTKTGTEYFWPYGFVLKNRKSGKQKRWQTNLKQLQEGPLSSWLRNESRCVQAVRGWVDPHSVIYSLDMSIMRREGYLYRTNVIQKIRRGKKVYICFKELLSINSAI